MTGILDRFTQSRTGFQPASMDELFALALAYRLGDHLAAEHYAELASEHSPERLVRVYHRALKAARRGGSLAAHFPSCPPICYVDTILAGGAARFKMGQPGPLQLSART